MKGVRVAPTGKNAQKSSIKELLYTTEAKSLKVREVGSATITPLPTNALITIPHNTTNYIPAYRIYLEVVPGSGQWYSDTFLSGGITGSTDPANAATFVGQIDNINLYVHLFGFVVGYSYKLRYFIFEDRLT